MSFKNEKIKLLLTMPHPWADLLRQMPHPGEDKAVKCPTNARGLGGGGRMRALELTEPLHLDVGFHHNTVCKTAVFTFR